jgi:hypothetical protein
VDSERGLRTEFRRALDNVLPPAPWLPTAVHERLREERQKGSWRGGLRRLANGMRLPRSSPKVAAAFLIVVLALAALGAFIVAHSLVSRSVPAGLAPPSGTIVFGRVDANGDEHLFTMRPDGTRETAVLDIGSGSGVHRSHKGDRLLWAMPAPAPNQNLMTAATVRVDGTGYTVLPLDSPGLSLGRGAWSPDDSRIAFAGFDDSDTSRNGIYTADATDRGNLRRVTTNGETTRDLPVSYSPDGSKILFWRGPASKNGTGRGQLFVVDIDGSHQTQVSPPNATVDFNDGVIGGWSPDGAQISFPALADTGGSAVFVAAGNGTSTRQITAWGTATLSARWSPIGDWIAFDRYSANAALVIVLVRPDGSGTKVVSSVGGVCCPVWSPDGERLLFSNGPSSIATDLWTVQLDGSHLTRLTHAPAEMVDFGWSAAT